ncbi:hypothetical protein Agub_g3799, partial [Astrephomene gubernaculifera]
SGYAIHTFHVRGVLIAILKKPSPTSLPVRSKSRINWPLRSTAMCIGSWTRAEVARGADGRGHSFSKSIASGVPSLLPAFPSSCLQQFTQPPNMPGTTASISPCSSRENSPLRSRQASSGLSNTSELSSDIKRLCFGSSSEDSDDVQPPQERKPHTISPAVLQEAPSFSYERGLRALWLDRHQSLRWAFKDDAPSPKDQPQQRMREPPADCLKYGPKWDVSKSLLWSLAEKHLLPEEPSSPSQQLIKEPKQHLDVRAQMPDAKHASSATPGEAPSPRSQKASSPATRHDRVLRGAGPVPPQLPAGIGPIGLSTTTSVAFPSFVSSSSTSLTPAAAAPSSFITSMSSSSAISFFPDKRRIKRAFLSVLAKGRLRVRRLSAAEQQQAPSPLASSMSSSSSEHATPILPRHHHSDPSVCFNHNTIDRTALDNDGWTNGSGSGSLPSSAVHNRGGGGDGGSTGSRSVSDGDCAMAHAVCDAVAKAVTACPVARGVVRRRVRAVVAGFSIVYAAVNLGDAATALMHADFSHDFASSSKAVLDFLATAPSVGGMAADLIHIGVAVGLGMAQRRPPEI